MLANHAIKTQQMSHNYFRVAWKVKQQPDIVLLPLAPNIKACLWPNHTARLLIPVKPASRCEDPNSVCLLLLLAAVVRIPLLWALRVLARVLQQGALQLALPQALAAACCCPGGGQHECEGDCTPAVDSAPGLLTRGGSSDSVGACTVQLSGFL